MPGSRRQLINGRHNRSIGPIYLSPVFFCLSESDGKKSAGKLFPRCSLASWRTRQHVYRRRAKPSWLKDANTNGHNSVLRFGSASSEAVPDRSTHFQKTQRFFFLAVRRQIGPNRFSCRCSQTRVECRKSPWRTFTLGLTAISFLLFIYFSTRYWVMSNLHLFVTVTKLRWRQEFGAHIIVCNYCKVNVE